MKTIAIIITAIVISIAAYSQSTNTDTLLVYSKFTTQGVMIKIAPQLAQTWLLGAENGYLITRTEIGAEGNPVLLTQKPLKPFTLTECAQLENGDSIKAFQQLSIFDNMAKNKTKMSMVDRIQFIDKLQNDYGFYYLLASRIRDIAKISGLEFLDKTAEKGKIYAYSVKIKGDKSSSRQSESIINTSENQIIIPELIAIAEDRSVDFNWIHRGGTDPVLCYYLEKSEDGKVFQRVNRAPFYYNPENKYESTETLDVGKILSHRDSLDANYKLWYYRLVGLDIWAMEHVSAEVVKVMGVDKTPPNPVEKVSSFDSIENKSITYKWDYDAPSDFAGFKLFVSDKIRGGYHPVVDSLLSPQTREFTLENITEGTPIFLRLVTFDTAGNYSFGNPNFTMLPDLYPPSSPTGFKAKIDSNGVLLLSWNANPEKDIRGYRILGANSKRERFISSTGLAVRDTFFIDTLNINSLSKYKYFRLEAIDNSFNTSEQTAYITVVLPDKVAPSPGLINEVIKENESIRINWTPSPSIDIKAQEILRRSNNNKSWVIAGTVLNTDTTFIEKQSEKGLFEYSLRAIDSSGNKGAISNVFAIKVSAKRQEISITDFKAKKKNGVAILSWSSEGAQPKFYLIYRETRNSELTLIASVSESNYRDVQVQKGITYKYYIVPQDEEGKKYTMSKIEKVGF